VSNSPPSALLAAIPDMVAFVRPDGRLVDLIGGRDLPFLQGTGDWNDKGLQDMFPAQVAALLTRLVRRALADRGSCEAEFSLDGATYVARLSAQGPATALCVIRLLAASAAAPADETDGAPKAGGRREFMRQLKRSLSEATLREKPLALCLMYLEGLTDIGSLIDFNIREHVMSELLLRLPLPGAGAAAPSWHVGYLGESMLALIIEGESHHDGIRTIVQAMADAIARPLEVHGATFRLTSHSGVAVFREDGARASALLDRARAAMLESRRSRAGHVQFYSDTLRMLPIARLDIERELRRAIVENQIHLHYVTRHELATGRVAGVHAYMRWLHPLQDEIMPAHFLPIANATGLSDPLSRAALERLFQDLPALRERYGMHVPVSFGALRQHVTSGNLLRDYRKMLNRPGEFGEFEFRIAERTLANLMRPERMLGEMVDVGVRLVVDEMGRDHSSLAALARLPVSALQIDRSLVVAARDDWGALRSCRAIAALARGLGVAAIATGIDDEAARCLAQEAGCEQGLGDHYGAHPATPTGAPKGNTETNVTY